tara:strand:- start:457 stop:1560 length:1104 start_codon:yes stop_codon:yes gene_type:complete
MKNIIFTVIAVSLIMIPTLLFLEIILPIFDNRGETIWRKDLHNKDLDIINSDIFFSNGNFDTELGWDYSTPSISDEVKYIAESYGASFTASGFSNDKTWQEQFYELSNLGIINLGIGGYGIDQSILKFEQYSRIKNKDVKNIILGLNGQVFSRSVSYYSYYYFFNQSFKYAFKPRFIKDNSEFRLLKIPCHDSECLKHELANLNSATYANLNKYDYWYKKEIEKPILKFPRIISYAKAIPSIIHRLKQRNYLAPTYFEDEESIELAKYLISRFSERAYLKELNPIILLMYDRFGLEGILKGKREDEWLIKFFIENKIAFIDTSPIFINHIKNRGKIEELFLLNGHYSFKGDSLVSLSIYNDINKFKL